MKCEIPLEYTSSILEALSRSNHVVILFDNELKVLCFNEEAKRFFEGYSLEEKSLFDLFPNLDETTVKYYLANDLIYQNIYEVTLSFREGSPFLGIYFLNSFPSKLKVGNFLFFLPMKSLPLLKSSRLLNNP